MNRLTPYDDLMYPMVLIWVDGQLALDIMQRMESFRMNEHLRKIDQCDIALTDPDRVLINDSRLESDTVWEVQWGYPTDMSSVRRMYVKHFEPDFDENGQTPIKVVLRAKSGSLLKATAGSRNYGKVASSTVAQKIAKRHNLKTRIEPSRDVDRPIIQPHGLDDYQFLHQIADAIDFEFFIDHETLYFRSKDTARSERPRMTFYYQSLYPTFLKRFTPVIRATGPTKVSAAGSDPKTTAKVPGAVASSKSNPLEKTLGHDPPQDANPTDPSVRMSSMDRAMSIDPMGRQLMSRADGSNVRMTHARVNLRAGAIEGHTADRDTNAGITTAETNKKLVTKLAQAKRRDALENAVKASAAFVGSPRIRPRCTYAVEGVDRRLAGLWYATDVTHIIDSNGYNADGDLRKGAYASKTKTARSSAGKASQQRACDPANASCISKDPKTLTLHSNGRGLVVEGKHNDVQSTQIFPASGGAPMSSVVNYSVPSS